MSAPPGEALGSAEQAQAVAPPRSKLRQRIVLLLKVALSAVLVWVLVQKGLLDLPALKRALLSPGYLCASLLIGFVGISSSGVRWWILLRYEGIPVPLWEAFRLNWVGHFFNMVFPGAVSGDAVKMYYVGRSVPRELREEAWTTVFADRVIGMVALVSVATVASLINLDLVWDRPELRALLLMMLGLIAAALVGMLLLASGLLGRGRAAELVASLSWGNSLARAYRVLVRLGRNWRGVLLAFVISFVSHGLAVCNALLLGRAAQAGLELSYLQFCTVIPLAMFSNAIPITPGGVGVGEAFLSKLFTWSGGAGEDGVTVMILMRVNFYVLALLGALLYVGYRNAAAPPEAPPDAPADGSRCPS